MFDSLELPSPEQRRPATWAPNPSFSVTVEAGDEGGKVGPDACDVVAEGAIALEDVLPIR
ncbi:MAG: hypothetical protein GEU90_02875 [Gemmatimonas sp.]|nr:hypothetical protein [Gemmatimonas sp.]